MLGRGSAHGQQSDRSWVRRVVFQKLGLGRSFRIDSVERSESLFGIAAFALHCRGEKFLPRRVGNFFTLEVFAAFACIQERSNLDGERTLRPLSLHRRELRAHISEFWREVRRRHVLLTQPACRGDFVVEILCPRECGRLPQYRNGIPLDDVRALLGAVVCVAVSMRAWR